jgi:hypothetical protein
MFSAGLFLGNLSIAEACIQHRSDLMFLAHVDHQGIKGSISPMINIKASIQGMVRT